MRIRTVTARLLVWSCVTIVLVGLPTAVLLATCTTGTPADDVITCDGGATVPTSAVGLAGDDIITVLAGGIADFVTGDQIAQTSSSAEVELNGFHDTITLESGSVVSGDVVGDDVEATGSPWGAAFGGYDVITVEEGATVAGNVAGDVVSGNGNSMGDIGIVQTANDDIYVHGTVDGGVYGDDSSSISLFGTVLSIASGDTIVVSGNAGWVAGDNVWGLSLSASCEVVAGADDITITGTVNGDVYGDYAEAYSQGAFGPCGGTTSVTGGDDTIMIAGTVFGDVDGDYLWGDAGSDPSCAGLFTSTGGDDTVTLADGADVAGLIDGGPHVAGDTLVFQFTANSEEEMLAFAADLATQDPASGSITFAGTTYTWANFEYFDNQLLIGWAIPTLAPVGILFFAFAIGLFGVLALLRWRP